MPTAVFHYKKQRNFYAFWPYLIIPPVYPYLKTRIIPPTIFLRKLTWSIVVVATCLKTTRITRWSDLHRCQYVRTISIDTENYSNVLLMPYKTCPSSFWTNLVSIKVRATWSTAVKKIRFINIMYIGHCILEDDITNCFHSFSVSNMKLTAAFSMKAEWSCTGDRRKNFSIQPFDALKEEWSCSCADWSACVYRRPLDTGNRFARTCVMNETASFQYPGTRS